MKGTNHLIQPPLVFWEPLRLLLIFDYEAAPLSRVDINPATSFPRVFCSAIFSLTTFEVRLFMVLIMLMVSKVTREWLQKCQGVTGTDRWLEKIGKKTEGEPTTGSLWIFLSCVLTQRERWIDTCTCQSSISGAQPRVGCWAGWKESRLLYSLLAFSCEIYLTASRKNTFTYLYSKGMYSLVMVFSFYSLWAWFMMLHSVEKYCWELV